ncbi:MAG: endolytic transglycosylase MltG [Nitrospira sp.]|nr:endolytic transglycosylase MltG [Nitrospira sp.]
MKMKKDIKLMLAGIVLVGIFYLGAGLLVPLPVGKKSVEVRVPKGVTFRQAVELFAKEGLMRDKNFFILLGKIGGLERRVRPGYYSVQSSMSPLDLFYMLKRGLVIEYTVTIVEGDSIREIGEKLSEKKIMSKDDFKRLSSDKEFLAQYGIKAPSLEGYLFPDTYNIPKGTDPEEAIGIMIERMRKEFSGEVEERASKLGMSEKEVLTLASIIEKEAKTDEERPLISAVYHNRLKRGIRLQADPTSIYGVKKFGETITTRDLLRKTPYNTYVIKGLPPGPICSPGLKSIIAAVKPADVPYLYFVSQNDGTHRFSVTEKEHHAAVKSYREKKQVKQKVKENR